MITISPRWGYWVGYPTLNHGLIPMANYYAPLVLNVENCTKMLQPTISLMSTKWSNIETIRSKGATIISSGRKSGYREQIVESPKGAL